VPVWNRGEDGMAEFRKGKAKLKNSKGYKKEYRIRNRGSIILYKLG